MLEYDTFECKLQICKVLLHINIVPYFSATSKH